MNFMMNQFIQMNLTKVERSVWYESFWKSIAEYEY